jgi:predicted transcriptional regulator
MKVGIFKFISLLEVGIMRHPAKGREDIIGSNKNKILLFRFIEATPGCHVRYIARALHLSKSAVIHHLVKLMQEEQIKIIKVGKFDRVYLMNHEIERDNVLHPTYNSVLDVLRNDMELSQSEILRIIDISQPTLSRCLNELVEKGLLARKLINNRYYYRINKKYITEDV